MRISKIDWNANRDEIVALYRQGYSTRSIGWCFGVSHTTVCKYLDRWREPRRGGDAKRGLLVKNLVGQRRGRLQIVGRDGESYPPKWIVVCDCGRTRSLLLSELTTYRSCGCASRGPIPTIDRKRVRPEGTS